MRVRRPLVSALAALTALAGTVTAAAVASPAAAASPTTTFIVTAAPGTVAAAVAGAAASALGGRVEHIYTSALNGFAISLPSALAPALAAVAGVTGIERDQVVRVSAVQRPVPSWGLDRIDQRRMPLNGAFTYPRSGAGVDAYVLDTGIRTDHVDFGGRAVTGIDLVDGGAADDCNGHGTHVAGTLGGRSYGVAKGVRLIAVRALGCDGSGRNSDVVAGVDWITRHHAVSRPAVANLSLSGGDSPVLDRAVARSIGDRISYAVAAGNDSTVYDPGLLGLFPSGGVVDACRASPSRVSTALTVGATDRNDVRAPFSDVGRCVDVFAPGTAIRSAWIASRTSSEVLSGTSMATPHVAGAAALLLQKYPRFTPNQISARLVSFAATGGVVRDAGPGSPNRLLFLSAGV